MKLLIKTFAILTALFLCLSLSGCGKGNTESAQTGITANQSGSKDRVITYQVIGMQNISRMEYDKAVFKYDGDKGEWEEQPVILGDAVCPKCGNTIRIQPLMAKENFGDDTYVYTDEACCMNDHDDQFFNGYFAYSVMYQKVED